MSIARRLRFAIVLLLVTLALGTTGYMLIEGWSLLNSFYMTVITVSTVGFKEVAPLSSPGKILTLCLIILGVGTVIYVLSSLIEFLIEGHFTGLMGRRRMKKQIESLKNHYIVCGYGRVGEEVVEELMQANLPFVIIENNPETIAKCKEEGLLYVMGDASDDQVLKTAGIEKAKGLVAVVDSDAENIFVTLSARVLNPKIFIVARAELEETQEKLTKAGADRVICPAVIGGKKIAALLLRPLVVDYLDIISSSEGIQFELEELEVKKGSSLAALSLEKTAIREKSGALILAIKEKEGKLNTAPSPSTIINEGDKLIVMGTKNQLEKLQNLI